MGTPHLYQVEEGWFETYSGRRFFFGRPQDYEYDTGEIAHALSMICRYNGHTRHFYSVAEHCCLIADWLLFYGHGPTIAFMGLHHDDAEVFIGDMTRPLKHTMPQFKELENTIDRAVATYFGLECPFPDIVKEADSRILCDEREQAMHPERLNEWGTDSLEPLGVRLEFWDPERAAYEWRVRHRSLSGLRAA